MGPVEVTGGVDPMVLVVLEVVAAAAAAVVVVEVAAEGEEVAAEGEAVAEEVAADEGDAAAEVMVVEAASVKSGGWRRTMIYLDPLLCLLVLRTLHPLWGLLVSHLMAIKEGLIEKEEGLKCGHQSTTKVR